MHKAYVQLILISHLVLSVNLPVYLFTKLRIFLGEGGAYTNDPKFLHTKLLEKRAQIDLNSFVVRLINILG